MAKMRSPNYPNIGLSEAVRAIQQIWDKEHRTPIGMDVIGKAMGYNSVSGPVRAKVAALRKYGLLDQTGGNFIISDLGMQILHSMPDSGERAQALAIAALRPDAFKELYETHARASDEAIRSYLLTKKSYSDSGAKQFIKSFRDTLNVAKPVQTSYSPSVASDGKEDLMSTQETTLGNVPDAGQTKLNHSYVWSWPLSIPRNVRAELKITGQLTSGDVRRLKKQIETLEAAFDDASDQENVPNS